MPLRPQAPSFPPRRVGVLAGLVLALACTCGPADANPPAGFEEPAPAAAISAPGVEASDPITRFLLERGLMPTAEADSPSVAPTSAAPQGLVDRMRDRATDLVMASMNFLGVPYRRGGNNAEEGFDCSGFTRHVFERSLGLVLPRRADEQASASSLQRVPRESLQPGDLVFFNTLRRTFSHVGIYVGDGKFVHAPRTGAAVRVEDMRVAYWSRRFTGARRASLIAAPADVPADEAAPARTSVRTSSRP